MSRLALAIVVAALALGSPAASAYMRLIPLDANYAHAYLTWSNGKAGISFQQDAATEDFGGAAASPNHDQDVRTAWTYRNLNGEEDSAHAIIYDEFETAPLARTLYLNVSRDLRLDVFFKDAKKIVQTDRNDLNQPVKACRVVDVELFVNETFFAGFIGGSIAPDYWSGAPDGNSGPASPQGYCLEYMAMRPELDRLPIGSRLRMRVFHHADGWEGPPQYGLKGDHQSVLHLPLIPPEELFSRVPEFVNPPPLLEATGAPEGLGGSGAAFVPVVLAFAWVPRGARRGAIAIAVALLFAGCTGTDSGLGASSSRDPRLGGTAGATYVSDPDNATGGTGAGVGSLVGSIHDDLRPVRDARVSVLGTSFSAKSSRWGQFSIFSMPQGSYEVQVVAEGYRVFVERFDVLGGRITKVDIELELLQPLPADYREHKHPAFPPGGRKVALRREIVWPGTYVGDSPQTCLTTSATCPVVDHSYTAPNQFTFDFEPQNPNVVLPGTYDIEVKVTWTNGVGENLERVALAFWDYSMPWRANVSTLYPHASGEVAHLRTGWEMTDRGHQKRSAWSFLLWIPTNVKSTGANYGGLSTVLFDGRFDVELTLVEGVVPWEPRHPDLWGGNSTLPLIDRDASKSISGTGPVCTKQNVSFTLNGEVFRTEMERWTSERKKVPYEAARLMATLEGSADFGTGHDWILRYKPANEDPPFTEHERLPVVEPKLAEARKLTFEIPVGPGEADIPYDGEYAQLAFSQWWFGLDVRKANQVVVFTSCPIQLYFTLVAEKGPV